MYNYGYDYGYSQSAVDATMASAGLLGLFMISMIFSLIISLVSIISYAKIFKKAEKSWWAAIVPIYNYVVMIEIAKLPMIYLLLLFIPVANIYAIFKINIEMAKRFGKSTGFGVGMTLLSIIFIPLLAFSDNKYEDDVKVENVNNQQFDANSVINGNTDNVNVAPANSGITIEPNNMAIDGLQGINVTSVEPVQNVVEPEPVSAFNAAPAEPIQTVVESEPVSAFNATPVEPIQNVVEPEPVSAFNATPVEPIQNVVGPEPVSAFNATPVESAETNNVDNIQSIGMDNTVKVCKNCGLELPEIVSICPSCGTDNE